MQPDAQVYSVMTIDRLTRSSEIVDHARLVPEVVLEVIVPIWGRT